MKGVRSRRLGTLIVWSILRSKRQFSIPEVVDLAKKSDVSRMFVYRYCQGLNRAGYIIPTPDKGIYKLEKVTGVAPPLVDHKGEVFDPNLNPPDGVTRMWLAMCVLKQFTLKDLIQCAEVKDGQARIYLSYLSRSGFLQVVSSHQRNQEANYLLLRNTGPLPPIEIRRGSFLLDQNTKKLYEVKEKK